MATPNIIDYSTIDLNLESLAKQFQELYDTSTSRGDVITRITLFTKCVDNREYTTTLTSLRNHAVDVWSTERRPIVSLAAQPTLESEATIEVHSCRVNHEDVVRHNNYITGGRSVTVKRGSTKLIFIGELQSDVMTNSIERQSRDVFERAKAILDCEGVPYHNIIRQWNYIERITAMEGENQHYQLFNNARSALYDQTQWQIGYPAATGIGCDWGGIGVDIDAVVGDHYTITPIDNKLQIAAHAYSERVLIDANANKSTPKFERAKSVAIDGFTRLTYISGTAAIRGESSVTGLDAAQQSEKTLENIEQLINEKDNIALLRIYIKCREDYQVVKDVVEHRYSDPNLHTIYLVGDVCREELLVEIEGVAIND